MRYKSHYRLDFNLLRVWMRNFIVWKKFFISYNLYHTAVPLMYILAVGYGLGGLIDRIEGVSYIEYFAPAMLAVTVMNTAAFTTTYESFSKLKIQKLFSAALITPTSLGDIVGGEIFWAASKAIIAGALVGLVLIILGIVDTLLLLASLPALLLLSIMFATLGLLVTGLAKEFDHFTYFFTAFLTPMFLFSGTFFPLHQLPGWAQWIAWFLPLTHGVSALRAIINGSFSLQLLYPLLWMAAATLLFFSVTIVLLRRRLLL